ncbi:MAG TPA: hypothetical protein VGS20_03295 [Candidatus Acidoferrales bacterium]|nr:hypothetical protein [Candidatus Acidoferrales bacterium]
MKPRALAHTPYHPRWYRPRVSTYWWLHQWSYARFVLRELTSIFVAWFVLLTLFGLRALERGPAAYAAYLAWLRRPTVVAIDAISFLFVLFHAVTWFSLAPRAMVLRVGGKRVPEKVIAGAIYAVWVVISVVLGRFLLGG